MDKLIIGSRGSDLALWQAGFIRDKLVKYTDLPIQIKIIKTSGDKIDYLSFAEMEGKGFFTKELEDELQERGIDLAVHSLKDLQTTMPEGLRVGAVCFREDPREIVLVHPDSHEPTQPFGVRAHAIIGTSSVRRQCQVANLAPTLQIKDLRGNVPTRVRKLREKQYDAIILAYAGLKRLKLDIFDLKSQTLETSYFLPAPGQGILGIQIRQDDREVESIVAKLDDEKLRRQVELERGLLARFDGGCQLPLAATSKVDLHEYHLRALLGVRNQDGWGALRQVEVSGTDTAAMVEEAYQSLSITRDR